MHGEQEWAAYNGHFGGLCYRPLFVFNQFGDCEGAKLHPGNVHSAHDWKEVLARQIQHLLKRPPGWPPRKPVVRYHDFQYQARSWNRPRRVVAKVEWHWVELFPRVGFSVTNMSAQPEGVVHFYNGRGTAEQWIKEETCALNWTRLSCHRIVANQVRLWLFILAYNLGNLLRRLGLTKLIKDWSLRSVQVKLIKIGGGLVRHARRPVFQLAEVAVPRALFQGVLERIGGLCPSPG